MPGRTGTRDTPGNSSIIATIRSRFAPPHRDLSSHFFILTIIHLDKTCHLLATRFLRFVKTAIGNNVVDNFVEMVDVYARQLPENTILPAFLALGGFTADALKLCETHGIGTAERIAHV